MKKPFVTLEQAKKIMEQYPTPFHIYDEKGIRENARKVNKAFSWNKGFREYCSKSNTHSRYPAGTERRRLRCRLFFPDRTDDV